MVLCGMSEATVHTRYMKTVDDLAAAWQFIMTHVDAVGTDVQIIVSPEWECDHEHDGECDPVRRFLAVVEGSVPVE